LRLVALSCGYCTRKKFDGAVRGLRASSQIKVDQAKSNLQKKSPKLDGRAVLDCRAVQVDVLVRELVALEVSLRSPSVCVRAQEPS
jgi:hypothetical protein